MSSTNWSGSSRLSFMMAVIFVHVYKREPISLTVRDCTCKFLFTVSFPRLGPILEPLIRMSGVMNTFPQLVDFAVEMIEMRKREENKATLVSS